MVALIYLSSCCLVAVRVPCLFREVSCVGLQCLTSVFHGHNHFNIFHILFIQKGGECSFN